MIDRALLPVQSPLQRIRRHGTGNRHTIVDARFNLRGFFIIIPCHQLEIGKRLARVVHAVEFGKCLQPGLPALLAHDAVRSPGCQCVVKSLVSRTHGLLARISHPRIVKARQVTHSIIGSGWHDPRVTSIRNWRGESAVILKNINRMRAQRSVRRVPVNRRIRKADVEIRHHRLSVDRHVGWRRKVGLFDVLQVGHERLLRRTP